jgi:hypothetical protein
MAQPSNLYVGFSYLRSNPAELVSNNRLNLYGWETGYTFKILPVFGITTDVTGDYGPATAPVIVGGYGGQPIIRGIQTTYQQYSFLLGPNVVPVQSGIFSISLHALAGGAVAATTLGRRNIPPFEAPANGGTQGAFSAAAGGSLDLRLTEHLGYRILQGEVLWTRFGATFQRDIRASTGITFLFGR